MTNVYDSCLQNKRTKLPNLSDTERVQEERGRERDWEEKTKWGEGKKVERNRVKNGEVEGGGVEREDKKDQEGRRVRVLTRWKRAIRYRK